MLGKREDITAVLAEHGRWLARLRDDAKLLDQRLRALERRVSTVEVNLSELARLYGRLDIALSKLENEESHKR